MQVVSPPGHFQSFAIWLGATFLALLASVALASEPAATGSDSSSPPRAARADDLPIVIEARELLETIERLGAEYAELKAQSQAVEDSDGKAVAEHQARDRLHEWMRSVKALVANVLEQQEQELDESHFRQESRKLLMGLDRRLPTFIAEVTEETAQLRSDLTNASPESVVGIEERIRGNEELLDETVRFFLSHIEHMDRLELGSTRARASAAKSLGERAGNLSARLEIASQRLEAALEDDGSGAANSVAARSAQEDFDRTAASLMTTCDVLDELGRPTAAHRRVLILATGELTTDVLDTDVLIELFDSAVDASQLWIQQRGPILVGRIARFLAVLGIFWILGQMTRGLTARLATSSSQQMSILAQRIVVTSASRVVMGIGILLALSQIGVNVTALLAGVGIVGFILGFALQETLGNFAAGAMILIYDPFDIGDVIEAAGVMGTVDQMNLVSTTILTFDNQTLIVPNSRIWGNVIRNTTAMDQRRVDLSFPLALDADVEQAEKIFESMCREHPAVLDEPELAIKVQEVTGAGVVVAVRPWVRTEDYWSTFWDLNREAHVRLNEAGIQIAAARYKLEDQDSTGSK
jgi:small conductance mechanosensitive channel